MSFYLGKYIIGLYEADDDTTIATFDNVQELARYLGKPESAVSGLVSCNKNKSTLHKMRLDGRLVNVHFIDVFEEDIMNKFSDFRDSWLQYLGDEPCIVYADGGKHGEAQTIKGKRVPAKTLNSPFFDRYDEYLVKSVKWEKGRVKVWLTRVS